MGTLRGKCDHQGAGQSRAALWWFPEAAGGWSLNLVGMVMESQQQEVEMRV